MSGEEIVAIVEDLFIGNELELGQVRLDEHCSVDLRTIRNPLVVFASYGDNITPPHQALGWIPAVYKSTEDLKACNQRIVYLTNQKIGHLGIFVSANVVRFEHRAILENLGEIERLSAGLYEMKIDHPTGDPDCKRDQYSVRFEPRNVEDIRFDYPRAAFDRVRQVSEFNEGLYRTFFSPWVQAMTNPWTALAMQWLHPMRTSRYLFSESFFPWMGAFSVMADAISKNRKALSDDHPLIAQERQLIAQISSFWETARTVRDFEHPEQNIEEAQLAKKRHIVAKLLVEPGHHVLDIGSGWGGLALYLAEQCGAQITGVTLSDEQLSIARRRAVKKGLASAVDFQLQDYRAIQGQFDRIVSVGMFEHVGVNYYDAFFSKAADLLADDGVMLVHSIGSIDGPSVTNPWVAKYIFPGGYLPALSEVLPAIERAGLIVTDIEILRLHYAQTLKAWRERFVSHRGEAAAIYDERFCRMWEFYLAGFEAAFRHGGLMVFQIQLAKRLDAVPLTRDYIAHREAALRLRETQSPALCVAAE